MMFGNEVPFYLIQTLHSIRLKNGMNSSEVAKKVGISVATYEEWEKDSSNISYSHILKLEEVFQMPSRYIFFGTDITLSNSGKSNELSR
jgi:transcriptional regulator with XRE-family HTH domain